jgi:hypothetical protein
LAAIHLFLHCVFKLAHNGLLLQEVGKFKAKGFVLTNYRQFIVAGFVSWFYFFMARTAKPKLDEKLQHPPPKSCEHQPISNAFVPSPSIVDVHQ